MATRYWRGGAVASSQVASASIDTVDGTPADNTFTVTIGGITVSQAGDTDVATTAAALVAKLNVASHPYFNTITWDNPSSGTITATADVPGVPFVASLTETGSGTGSVTDFSDTSASSSPYSFGQADNWDAQTLPVDNDTIIFSGNAVNCVWDMDQSALDGLTLCVDHSYTGKIGLRREKFATSADGESFNTTVPEYRGTALSLDYDVLEIGRITDGQVTGGSSRLNIDNTNTGSSTTRVNRTGSRESGGPPAVQLSAASANADFVVREATGHVGIGTEEPGATMTCGAINVVGATAATVVQVADGVTWTTYAQTQGTGHLYGATNATSAGVSGGVLHILGSGYNIATGNVDGGTMFHDGDVDFTTALNVAAGVYDGRKSKETRTVTQLNHSGGTVYGGENLTITSYVPAAGAQITVVS